MDVEIDIDSDINNKVTKKKNKRNEDLDDIIISCTSEDKTK